MTASPTKVATVKTDLTSLYLDVGAADLINCGLHRIKDISVVMSEQDHPYFVTKHNPKTAKAAIEPADDMTA